MEQVEMSIGEATYLVSRVYVGTRPVGDLLLDRLADAMEHSTFDGEADYEI